MTDNKRSIGDIFNPERREVGKIPVGQVPFEGSIAIPKEDGSGETFFRVPHYKDGKTPPGLDELRKFAREHPETKLWLWDGSDLRPL